MTDASLIRIAVFALVLIFCLSIEAGFSLRKASLPRNQRWPGNFGLFVIGALLTRVFAVCTGVSAALWAAASGWGVMNSVPIPLSTKILLGFIFMDFAIWAQHVALHKVPLLWRLHRVHHADTHMDVSTGLRFHPLEILFSLAYKAALIIVLGIPAMAVIIFDVVLNAFAMFTHSNFNLLPSIERRIRYLLVTPNMHRAHHSVYRQEMDTNYGFCLSVWDRLFRTYTREPRDGHAEMRIGLPDWRTADTQRLSRLLILPFRRS